MKFNTIWPMPVTALIGDRDPIAGALDPVTEKLVAQAVDQDAYGVT